MRPYIVLNDEQSQVLADAVEPIEVRDKQGAVLAHIDPCCTSALIAEAKRRLQSDQPRFSSQQVKSHLQALQQAFGADSVDAARARELLKALQAQPPS